MKLEAGFEIRSAAERFADRVAFTFKDQELSFRQVNASANAFGSGLAEYGIGPGDRVGLLSFNRMEVVQAWFALEKRAMVRLAMHTHTDIHDHRDLLNNVGAKAFIFDTRFAKQIDSIRADLTSVEYFVAIGSGCPDWAVPFKQVIGHGSSEDVHIDVDEDDPCFMQLTSGTTGTSKPWVKSFRSWLAVITHNLTHLDTFDSQPAIDTSDVNLHFHPLQWATGFQTLYPYFIRGARTVIAEDDPFDPGNILDIIRDERVTGVFAPAPLLSPILDQIEARGGVEQELRRIVVFFALPDVLDRVSHLIGDVWASGFGSTEQGAITTRLLPSEVKQKRSRIDSVGRAGSPNFEVGIIGANDEWVPRGHTGEIVVRSAMSEGYYWDASKPLDEVYRAGDWFRSGDVGYIDDDGFLFYSDRAGDTIFRGGVAIYPHLVEAAVLKDEAVDLCGVVGLNSGDDVKVVAAVRLKAAYAPDEMIKDRIVDSLNQTLDPSNLPVHIEFVKDLPTVLGGAKVQRSALREQLEAAS